jgi:hypothetical protein
MERSALSVTAWRRVLPLSPAFVACHCDQKSTVTRVWLKTGLGGLHGDACSARLTMAALMHGRYRNVRSGVREFAYILDIITWRLTFCEIP